MREWIAKLTQRKKASLVACVLTLTVLALAGCTFLVLANYCEVPHGQEQANATHPNPTDKAEQFAPDSAFVKVVKAIRDGQQAQNDHQKGGHNESNWRRGFVCEMKFGEFVLSTLTLLLVLGTIALAIYTYGLWRESKTARERSDTDAVEQANNMRHSLSLAKTAADASRRSAEAVMLAERAYLKMTFQMPGVRWKEQNGNGLFIDSLVKNFGRTPASVTDIRMGICLREHGDLLPESFPYPLAQRESIPNGFLLPGDDQSFEKYFGLKPGSRNEIQTADKRLWVFGHVDYIDTFGTRHRAGLARLYERALEGRTDSTNLMLSTERRYDFDRLRDPGEGDDWPAETEPKA